jgi:hypothetical protein
VSRLVDMPSRCASRAPARPASASAIVVNVRRSSQVWRDRGVVNSVGCSANVRAGHAGLRQKNLRTCS